jgi:polygalacturonase
VIPHRLFSLRPAAGLACLALAASALPALSAAPLADYIARAPFPMPAVPQPSFPDRNFPITAFGAVGDGHTLATQAIAQAIAACVAAGGGHVIIPAGMWLTGPIELKSNVDLHSDRGALILFTGDHTAYPMVYRRTFGFVTISPIDFVPLSPIDGIDLRNVAITGEGIFDGAGDTWRPIRRHDTPDDQWNALVAKGGVVSNDGAYWWPTKEAMAGEDYLIELSHRQAHPTAQDALPGRDFRRPPLCYLDNCDTVLIEGVTLRNAPSGDLGPSRCTNLTIRDATFFNDWWAATGDGMDVNTCQNVLIYHCTVSAGDDAICLKSTGYTPVQGDAALRNVIIAECTVYRGHGGFVLGGYTDDGMRNVWATRCAFVGTDIGIRVKSGAGHGGLVHAIFADHLSMKAILGPAILFDTHYDNHPPSVLHSLTHDAHWFATHTEQNPAGAAKPVPLQPDDPTKIPEFRDFLINDINCQGASMAISITGLPQHPVHRITFQNLIITAQKGLHATDAADILLKNVQIHTPESPAAVTKNTVNLQFMN